MASYLLGVGIGHFRTYAYARDGLRFLDAIDPDLFVRPAPTGGEHFAISRKANASYKRLAHVVDVPAGGATLAFSITLDTEPSWDHVFVEAHTVGEGDWTTLPDLNGHTNQDLTSMCPYELG